MGNKEARSQADLGLSVFLERRCINFLNCYLSLSKIEFYE